MLNGVSTFNIGCHQIPNPTVSKCPAAHYAVIPTSGAVGIKIASFNAAFLQILSCGTRCSDRACRGDMVSCDRISEDTKNAGIYDV